MTQDQPRLRRDAGMADVVTTSTQVDETQKLLEKSKNATVVKPAVKRQPLFVYPALPRWEMTLCWAVVLGALIFAWTTVFRVSQRWAERVVDASAMRKLPFIGWRFKDEIDWEWSRWSPMAQGYLPYLIGHFILFNIADQMLSKRYAQVLSVVYSIFASARTFGAPLVAFSISQGLFLFCCTFYFSLFAIMNYSSLLSNDVFHVLLFASYSMLSYISFCIEWSRGALASDPTHEGKEAADKNTDKVGALLRRMFFYAFYQPYLFSLIVTCSDFERQYANRKKFGARNWRSITWRFVRVAFWWVGIELVLHFLYFGSVLHDERFFARLPKDEFVTMGMAVGAFFHLKYVVIFGLPAAFALADGMTPPDGAICISRVALYSKIWRGFDRGLYAFFKAYIFLPICAPSFSAGRRVTGVMVSYLFVLVWHGFHHQNLVWIGLNIVELFIEYGAKAIYSIPAVRGWRERHLSATAFRRWLGVGQIVPFAFGLYSNFYFLGGSRVGWLFVQRIFIEETVLIRWPFLLLISIGYFYMQVSMEVERLLDNQSNTNDVTCPFSRQNDKNRSDKKE